MNTGWYRNRWMLAALLALGLLVGCGSAAPTAAPTLAQATGPAPTATLPPSPLPTPSEAVASTPVPPTPTHDPTLPDVPYDLTGEEIIASRTGLANYSGYTCLITPAGCSCELPLLQKASFTFTPDGLEFHFEGDGYGTTWTMQRVGPNQWEESKVIHSEVQNQNIGEARALLSFTTDGYIYTQLYTFNDTGVVTCPDITFRRLSDSP
jgi:hypothetical protein